MSGDTVTFTDLGIKIRIPWKDEPFPQAHQDLLKANNFRWYLMLERDHWDTKWFGQLLNLGQE